MVIETFVKTSGAGPRDAYVWAYPANHRPLRDGRVVAYWVRCAQFVNPRDGVAVIIRVQP
jgi:hypothetical protein